MSVCLGTWKWILVNLTTGKHHSKTSRSLMGSLKGDKILLAVPLLKWYLDRGLEVTKVQQEVEFTSEPCFKPFGDGLSKAGRVGDADSSKAIMVYTMKLVSFCFIFRS